MNTSKETILITGSSGHIATALIHRLAGHYDIAGLDFAGTPASPAQCIRVDMESSDSVTTALDQMRQQFGNRLAAVIHLAAYFSFTGAPNPKYYTVNVLGTQRLLRALQAFEVGQFVFSSAMLVHAPQPPGRSIREDSPLDPKWDYPQSKVEAEQVIRQEHGRIPAAILRIAGVYDGMCRLPALAQQIQRIYERKLIGHVFPGDSSHGQAAIHRDDLVDAIAAVIERRASLPPAATFLIGEPETPSYADLQRELGRMLHGEPWDTREIPKALAKTGAWLEDVVLPKDEEPFIQPWMIDLADDHYQLDIARARDWLGWTPQRRVLTELPEIVYALKHDPVAWYRANKLDMPDDLASRCTPPPQACETRPRPPSPH